MSLKVLRRVHPGRGVVGGFAHDPPLIEVVHVADANEGHAIFLPRSEGQLGEPLSAASIGPVARSRRAYSGSKRVSQPLSVTAVVFPQLGPARCAVPGIIAVRGGWVR